MRLWEGNRFANEKGFGFNIFMLLESHHQPAEKTRDAVLVIDDEAPLLDLYSSVLSSYFDVVAVSSVKDAQFALHKRSFRVVVADHMMPGGNGLSFLVQVREEYPEAARILVTGFMKPEMLLRAVNEAAVFRYLLKPIDLREFVTIVRDAAKPVGQPG